MGLVALVKVVMVGQAMVVAGLVDQVILEVGSVVSVSVVAHVKVSRTHSPDTTIPIALVGMADNKSDVHMKNQAQVECQPCFTHPL